MTHFNARLGPLQKGYTVILLAAIAGIAVVTFFLGRADIGRSLLLVMGLLLLVGLFSVRGYDVTEGRLIIRRPGWRTGIDLSELDIASPEPKLLNSSISLWST